ncbi:MAG: 4Fe-4S binding protein [Sphingomonadaceae bacterium]
MRSSVVSRLLRWPWFPLIPQATLLAAATAVVVLALRPPQRSEMNLGAALVWQLWWTLLPFFILLTARLWCAVCPFSALGDLAQRLRRPALPLPPARLRAVGPWIAALGLAIMGFLFLLLSLESSGPFTALLLLALASGALVSSLLWRGRAWCRYLCPLGLMAGLYSRLAWLRLSAPSDARYEGRGKPTDTPPIASDTP